MAGSAQAPWIVGPPGGRLGWFSHHRDTRIQVWPTRGRGPSSSPLPGKASRKENTQHWHPGLNPETRRHVPTGECMDEVTREGFPGCEPVQSCEGEKRGCGSLFKASFAPLSVWLLRVSPVALVLYGLAHYCDGANV